MNPFLVLLAIVLFILVLAPYIISFRLNKLGSALASNDARATDNILFSSWAKIKGTGTFTRQPILVNLKAYQNDLSVKFLWGKELYLPYTELFSAKRLFKGPKTTGVKLTPRNAANLEEIIITGMNNIPKFLEVLKDRANIATGDELDSRSMLDIVR